MKYVSILVLFGGVFFLLIVAFVVVNVDSQKNRDFSKIAKTTTITTTTTTTVTATAMMKNLKFVVFCRFWRISAKF